VRRAATLLLLLVGLLPARADFPAPPQVEYQNVPYDGRFTFARIKYRPSRWRPGDYAWGLDLGWNHDYPRAEAHFLKILKETTSIDPNMSGNILGLDEPDLFKYPVAYMCEPGFWTMTDEEAAALRAYLLKGGFLIVDDMTERDAFNLEEQLGRALPGARFQELTPAHPIFDSFFRIESPPAFHPYRRGLLSSYQAIFEDNDPAKRMLVIANFNNDMTEYWEWSDTGFLPIDLSNDAYKLGVNYVVYGMTH
jgi:hypothetical protein